jgi:hypothetical protein
MSNVSISAWRRIKFEISLPCSNSHHLERNLLGFLLVQINLSQNLMIIVEFDDLLKFCSLFRRTLQLRHSFPNNPPDLPQNYFVLHATSTIHWLKLKILKKSEYEIHRRIANHS